MGCTHALLVQPHHLYFYTDAGAQPSESALVRVEVCLSPAPSLCVRAWKAEVTRVGKSPYGNVWGLLLPTAARAAPLLPVYDSCVLQVSSISASSCEQWLLTFPMATCLSSTVSASLTPEEQRAEEPILILSCQNSLLSLKQALGQSPAAALM